MARIAGVDLPAKKRSAIGLTYIYGIGRTRALSLLYRAQVDPDKKISYLSEEEVNHLRNLIEGEGAIEGAQRVADIHIGERGTEQAISNPRVALCDRT